MRLPSTLLWVLVAVGATGCKEPVKHEPLPEAECDALPPGPLPSTPVHGHANEDITFDVDGDLIGADGAQNLWRAGSDGSKSMILPNSGVRAGLRSMWWDGRLASAQYATGAIYAIDPRTGSKELLVANLGLPTGIETGLDESIWFTEIASGRLQRFHVPTSTLTLVASGHGKLQGLSFSPDYDLLYFAAIEESRIYAIDIDPETMDALGEPWVFAEDAGNTTDGLGVDACGNVYVGSWMIARVYRYAPDGSGPEMLVDEPGADHALGNFAWGSEVGGWSPTRIYTVETGKATVRALDLGVREKPRPSL